MLEVLSGNTLLCTAVSKERIKLGMFAKRATADLESENGTEWFGLE